MLILPQRREVLRTMFGMVCGLASTGCISITTKSELPGAWRSALLPSGTANLSGSYSAQGERFGDGRLGAANLRTFLPALRNPLANPATYRFQQVGAKRLEIFDTAAEMPSRELAVNSNAKTGEVSLPQFAEHSGAGGEKLPQAGVVHVTLIRGRDGGLYARKTATGVAMYGPLPAAGSIRIWARFPPLPR